MFTLGQYDENGATGVITLAASSVTELEFAVMLTLAALKGDTYDFRVYRGTSTALNTYSNTPRVTVTQYHLVCDKGAYALVGPATVLTGVRNYPLACAGGAYVWAIADTGLDGERQPADLCRPAPTRLPAPRPA